MLEPNRFAPDARDRLILDPGGGGGEGSGVDASRGGEPVRLATGTGTLRLRRASSAPPDPGFSARVRGLLTPVSRSAGGGGPNCAATGGHVMSRCGPLCRHSRLMRLAYELRPCVPALGARAGSIRRRGERPRGRWMASAGPGRSGVRGFFPDLARASPTILTAGVTRKAG